MKFHPIADLFPMLPDEEMEQLVDDMKVNGQLETIVVDKASNMIVDGRNRWRACEIAFIGPRIQYIEFANDAAIASFVMSKNVRRRHMSVDQRAAIGAELANLQHGERADYIKRGPDAQSQASGTRSGHIPISQMQAAKIMGVGRTTIQEAMKRKVENPEAHGKAKAGIKQPRPRKSNRAGERKRSVMDSGEKDLIAGISDGSMKITSAYDELIRRRKNIVPFPQRRPRKPIPIEQFVRDLVKTISSVVRSGKLSSVVESSEFLSEEDRMDVAYALRDMARAMIKQADELCPESYVIENEECQYES